MTDSDASLPHGAVRRRPLDSWLRLRREEIPLKNEGSAREDEDFELEFLENVVSEDPIEESSLILLGHLYTRRGEYRKGLEVDRRLARLRPDDPVVYYNLACSLSLVSQIDEAYAALEKSVELGYRDFEHLLKDPDLELLREDSRFRGFCKRMGFGVADASSS